MSATEDHDQQELVQGLDRLTLLAFNDLPFEILVKISGVADPPDIRSLEQTCRLMRSVARERSVWLTAFQSMCIKNDVFLPSFGDLSQLTTWQLRRIASGPYNFLRRIADARASSVTQPFVRPVVSWPLWMANFRPRGCSRIYLVPGGRYLFTLHRTDLHIWDLGIIHTTFYNPTLLFTDVRSFGANPTSQVRTLRLSVRKRSLEPGWRHYEMHNLDFSVYPPSTTLLSSFSLRSPGHRNFDSVDGDRCHILTGSIMTVWNFVQNESVSWDTRTTPRQFFVEGDAVGVIDERVLAIWKVPPLQPNAPEAPLNESPPPFIEPDVTLMLPPPEEGYFLCRALGDWYTGSAQPVWFDLVEGTETSFVRLKLEKTDPDDVSTYRLVSCPRSALPKDHSTTGFQIRVCDDSSVLTWVSKGRSVKCHVGPPFFDEPGDQDNYVVLCKVNNPSKRQFSLCPVTGRYCYVDYDDDCIVTARLISPPTPY